MYYLSSDRQVHLEEQRTTRRRTLTNPTSPILTLPLFYRNSGAIITIQTSPSTFPFITYYLLVSSRRDISSHVESLDDFLEYRTQFIRLIQSLKHSPYSIPLL